MSTTKKLTIAVVALALSLVLVVGGTLAYLVAESNSVTNTFTYGDVQIELWETDLSGKKTDKGVVYPNIVPGDAVDKNPTVTVTANSEACYVYVMVTNGMVLDGKTIATYTPNSAWTKVGESGTTSLYCYNEIVPKADTNTDLTAVFNELTFDSALTVSDIEKLKENADAKITVNAYAHQADNTTVDVANAAAKEWAGITAAN